MKVLLIDCGSTKVQDIIECIKPTCEVVVSKMEDITIPKGLTGVIISGAPILLTETNPKSYTTLFTSLIQVKTPILGICFGHQILGLISGAKADRCADDRTWNAVTLDATSKLFSDLPPTAKFMEDHCEVINLPVGYKSTAISDRGLEAMEHKTAPIYGVQFHPEVSGKNGQKVFDNFIQICRNHVR